jgi:hypothetical protein
MIFLLKIKYTQSLIKYMHRNILITFFITVFIFCSCFLNINPGITTVIYVTDLYHPYADPDDHFDLAALYALKQIDIRSIIIDYAKPHKTPGRIPIEQLNFITNRKIPVYLGLKEKLTLPDDTGESQSNSQEGCNAILNCLEQSDNKVTIISVGSLRDIAAAYNRNPNLFENKVDKLIIFIGESSNQDFFEYNVRLDKNAYIRVMNNIPNIWWIPCFDGGSWQNNGNASYWSEHRSVLLKGASDPIINYFLYAFTKSTDSINYIPHLYSPVNTEDLQSHILDSSILLRNLWCCSVFPYFVEKDKSNFPFTFEQVSVSVDSNAVLHYTGTGNKLMRFAITDTANYNKKMTAIFNEILRNL